MRNVTPEEDLAIWQKDTLYPEKPPQTPYGYIPYKGNPVGVHNLEELKAAFSAESGSVYGVWRPERPRIIPIAEAPELLEELKPKRIQQSTDRLKSTRLFLFLGGAALLYFSFPAIQSYGWQFYKFPGLAMTAIMFVAFALQPYYLAWKSKKAAENLTAENLSEEALEVRYELWMARQESPFTKALTFILIGFALLQYIIGRDTGYGFQTSLEKAGLVNKSLLNGETWRLWTAPFLHGGPIHIFFNASALWYLGKRVEVLAKWAHFLMVFIFSALAGSFASIHFLPILPDGTGVNGIGASGGIMGLLGFLLTFELLHPKLAPKPARRRLAAMILMMFVIGFIGVAFIDNAAHAGGLLAGAAYALLAFSKSDSAKRPQMQGADWMVGIGSLLLIIWAIFLTYTRVTA